MKYVTNHEMFHWIDTWIKEEPDPILLGVLATLDEQNTPHTRTVVIREITSKGILFFTQMGSKKVKQMEANPHVSLTLVLSAQKRQITFRGVVEPISEEENIRYWESYPKQSQLRFLVYGPQSGESVPNNALLDEKLAEMQEVYKTDSPKRPEAYVGYTLHPETIDLYQMNPERISDAYISMKKDQAWEIERVVP